jgi:hypothetical protein
MTDQHADLLPSPKPPLSSADQLQHCDIGVTSAPGRAASASGDESSTRRPPCRSGLTANRATRNDSGASSAYRYM